MRRKPLPPDTRLDWRDPNMPVLRDYRFGSGAVKTKVDPDYESRYREHLLSVTYAPTWHNDPTYNLRKRK